MPNVSFREHLLRHLPLEEAEGILSAQRGSPTHAFYLNTKKMDVATLLSLYPNVRKHPFVPNAYYYDEEEYPLGKSLWHNLGAFYILDAASLLVPYFLSPKKGERVLDCCAAPGGKTCLCAMSMEGQGAILSNDRSYSRSLLTSQNVERLGLGNVAVVSGDLESAHVHYESYFDAIVLDAPCSGSAMFRKEPKMAADWTEAKVIELTKVQARLLELSAHMLAPGGRLIYSTCSFSYEEDEGIVLPFLQAHPDFEILPLEDHPGFYHHEDLPEGVHLYPHRYEGEGQFLCLLHKKGDGAPHLLKPTPIPASLSAFTKDFELDGFSYRRVGEVDYALAAPLEVQGLSLLRYGVKLGEGSPNWKPDHALSSFAHETIDLDESLAKAYLRGETFRLNEKNGFAVVSYRGVPLGFVKIVQGIAKNHYPKGLRRSY